MSDNWKQIKDFEMYEISNEGKVRRMFGDKEHILAPIKYKIKNGGWSYVYVMLFNGNKKQKLHISYAVAEYFKEDYDPILNVFHKDNNKENCHVDNLYQKTREWCKENKVKFYGYRVRKNKN